MVSTRDVVGHSNLEMKFEFKKKSCIKYKYFWGAFDHFLVLQVSRKILKSPWYIRIDKCDLIYGRLHV